MNLMRIVKLPLLHTLLQLHETTDALETRAVYAAVPQATDGQCSCNTERSRYSLTVDLFKLMHDLSMITQGELVRAGLYLLPKV